MAAIARPLAFRLRLMICCLRHTDTPPGSVRCVNRSQAALQDRVRARQSSASAKNRTLNSFCHIQRSLNVAPPFIGVSWRPRPLSPPSPLCLLSPLRRRHLPGTWGTEGTGETEGMEGLTRGRGGLRRRSRRSCAEAGKYRPNGVRRNRPPAIRQTGGALFTANRLPFPPPSGRVTP